VSTGSPGRPKATERITFPVFRPTPGSFTRSLSADGISPPNDSSTAAAMPRRLLVFWRKKPVEWTRSSSTDGSAWARSAAVG